MKITCYINPIRNTGVTSSNVLAYDASSNEVFYTNNLSLNTIISNSGTINGNLSISGNASIQGNTILTSVSSLNVSNLSGIINGNNLPIYNTITQNTGFCLGVVGSGYTSVNPTSIQLAIGLYLIVWSPYYNYTGQGPSGIELGLLGLFATSTYYSPNFYYYNLTPNGNQLIVTEGSYNSTTLLTTMIFTHNNYQWGCINTIKIQ